MEKRNKFYIAIAIILTINGVISLAWSLRHGEETLTWALLSAEYMFFAGLTQAGIAYSALMRIAGAEWGRHYSGAGEMITLSSAPAVFIMFIFIVLGGGAEHLFFWISQGNAHTAITSEYNPVWFNKSFFIWRNIISMGLFYIISYWYHRMVHKENVRYISLISSLVIISYVLHNTILAWDFGMTIIPGWESNIFPPYFIAGNIFSGTAFLLLVYRLLFNVRNNSMPEKYLVPVGKLLLGYTLLWIYMLWSQYIVIWYGDIPRLTEPLFRQMTGNYSLSFSLMIMTAFTLPFIALIQRWTKSSVSIMMAVCISICTGIWINRYLMVVPVFSEGSTPVALTWTGLSLTGGGLGVIFFSVISFRKLSPHNADNNADFPY